jgi:hypothetical protein
VQRDRIRHRHRRSGLHRPVRRRRETAGGEPSIRAASFEPDSQRYRRGWRSMRDSRY